MRQGMGDGLQEHAGAERCVTRLVGVNKSSRARSTPAGVCRNRNRGCHPSGRPTILTETYGPFTRDFLSSMKISSLAEIIGPIALQVNRGIAIQALLG